MFAEVVDSYNSVGLWITGLATAAFFSSLAAGIISRRKRRNQMFWMIFCFVLPPVLALLILLPKGRGPRRPGGRDEDDADSLILPA
jgi:hypothetical protein